MLPGDSQLDILPEIAENTTCLELGCGAAQNSICLARRGARCTAIDISSAQIEHAKQLAQHHGVEISLQCAALEDEDAWPEGQYDFVHSVYALPFVDDPESFIRRAAARVAPGGTLLISTQHPVFAAEWLELEDEEMGLFLPSYFDPPEDLRQTATGELIGSSAYPISRVSEWIHSAGLRNLRLWEPEPLPMEAIDQAPYHSPAWKELHPKLAAAPVSIIYTATMPDRQQH